MKIVHSRDQKGSLQNLNWFNFFKKKKNWVLMGFDTWVYVGLTVSG